MTAFSEHYKPKVEKFINRKLSDDEYTIAHLKYIEGWHPIRTAKFLQLPNLRNEKQEMTLEKLEKFFQTLTDMELVALIADSRKVNDIESLNSALVELGRREKGRPENTEQNIIINKRNKNDK